jgi:hypothetical protein
MVIILAILLFFRLSILRKFEKNFKDKMAMGGRYPIENIKNP